MYKIEGNEFVLSSSMYDTIAQYKLPSYTAHLPDNYFKYLQSPLLRIKIPAAIDEYYADLLDTEDLLFLAIYTDTSAFSVANVTIYNNFFDT